MKVKYIKKSNIESEANDLLLKHPDIKDGTKIDVISLASSCLGLKIRFEDLQSIYGKKTLGMLFDSKIIICDKSLEPCGADRINRENILRFTIAHEIGHYILHQSYMNKNNASLFHKNLPNKEQGKLETQANIFAASLLMPANKFKDRYHHIINQEIYDDYIIKDILSGEFRVSKEASGFRIKNLGL